ncbi:MAG: plasmid stabilization protein [Chloroflexi bacterium]|nr:plasmid stabilization protein [Chloroflexota bacterium]
MATITVRGLDEALKRKLRIRAANNGRSMEQEVRVILFDTLEGNAKHGTGSLFDEIRADVAELGGADLELPVRELIGEPLKFD